MTTLVFIVFICYIFFKEQKKCAQCGAQTHDPGIKSPMLYQLS